MGFAAGRKARRAVECFEYVVAIELLCASQALEFLRPLKPGLGVQMAYDLVRSRVSPLDGDRVLAGDIEIVRQQVQSGAFEAIATAARAGTPRTSPTDVANGNR